MDRARQWIAQARSIAVLTGAGASAESGIPTFRGADGLWRNYRAEDLATPRALQRNPKLVWEWYLTRRQAIARAQPNAGHKALVELERRSHRFTLITQNVDGLHRRAGSRHLLEVHGNIWTTRCVSCGRIREDYRTEYDELPPRCECGGMERPGVILFGELLDGQTWMAAEQAAADADVFLVAGTSAVVYPAAGLAQIAKAAGARVIEVNLEETALSGFADCTLTGRCGEILPLLLP